MTCTFCGISFYPDIPSERTHHRKRHDAFEEAAKYLSYAPKQHAEREAMKKAGYEMLCADTLDKQVEGLLMVARGWFDRSLDAAIDSAYWKQHPTFEAYVSYVIGDLEHLPAAAVKAVMERYGRVEGVIPQGKSTTGIRRRRGGKQRRSECRGGTAVPSSCPKSEGCFKGVLRDFGLPWVRAPVPDGDR